VNESYVRVGGKWKYLFRAIDKHGQLIDFKLSDRRNTRAAYRFLRGAVKRMSDYPSGSITTDKLASYPKAIRRLQNEGLLPNEVAHRTSKTLNNIIEADHGALKRVSRPTRGFQRMRTARAAIKGVEVMRMIRHGHRVLPQPGATGKIRTPINCSALPPDRAVPAGSLCSFQIAAPETSAWRPLPNGDTLRMAFSSPAPLCGL
jgi:transposase, IS6 family